MKVGKTYVIDFKIDCVTIWMNRNILSNSHPYGEIVVEKFKIKNIY